MVSPAPDPSPSPKLIMHFTHVSHIAAIAADGLLSDTAAQATASFKVEVGNAGIKEQRRRRPVPVAPGGVVADYAPFYYAPQPHDVCDREGQRPDIPWQLR
jgi:hypothetical protein